MAYSLVSGFIRWLSYQEPVKLLLIGLENVCMRLCILAVFQCLGWGCAPKQVVLAVSMYV